MLDNEKVSVSLERFGNCEVEMSVSVKPEACQEIYNEALKSVRQQVSLPGFRKGKAPLATIKKQYMEAIDERWKDELMNTAAREALSLTSLYPWSSEGIPQPKVESISLEEGATIIFHFETEPEVPSVKKEDVKIKRNFPEETTDEMVDKELNVLRSHHASYEPIEEAAEKGSFVRVDVESLADEKPEKVVDNHLAELVKGKTADWLCEMVIGHKAGDVVEGETSVDEDASDEEKKAFEKRACRVTLRSVEKQIPPEDEVLIDKVKAESMDDLRKKLRERLEHEAKEKAEQSTKEELWKLLFENYKFELPKSLVEAEERASIQRTAEDLKRQGLTDDQIIAREKEVEMRVKQEVAQRLHGIFLSRKIVSDIDEQPSDKELGDRALHLLMWEAISQGRPAPTSPDPKVLEAYRHHAFLLIVREKVEAYFLA